MYSKLKIEGKIKVLTGLHIGGSKEFSAIGAVDSPVLRDTYSNLPFIPGSTLKGKLRHLLQEKYGEKPTGQRTTYQNDVVLVKRLFGGFGESYYDRPYKSRLYFSDAFISNEEELQEIGFKELTEIKFENSINRFTAIANPRQIERVIRGVEFDMNIIYNVEEEEEIEEDIKNLKEGFILLENDYLGGNGTRGYGRVKIENLKINQAFGNMKPERIAGLKKIIGEI